MNLRLEINGLLLFAFFCIVSCQKNGDLTQTVDFPNVDEELVDYFQRFETEAKVRGIMVDLTSAGITRTIRDIAIEHVAGQCSYGTHESPHVTIDSEFWDAVGDLYKEMVVFHELGHCYLKRGHLEGRTINGNCISIMRSGDGSCRDNYTATTRQGYIDELFFNYD